MLPPSNNLERKPARTSVYQAELCTFHFAAWKHRCFPQMQGTSVVTSQPTRVAIAKIVFENFKNFNLGCGDVWANEHVGFEYLMCFLT